MDNIIQAQLTLSHLLRIDVWHEVQMEAHNARTYPSIVFMMKCDVLAPRKTFGYFNDPVLWFFWRSSCDLLQMAA